MTSSVAGLKSEIMVGYAYAATKAAVVNTRTAGGQWNCAPHGVHREWASRPRPFRTNYSRRAPSAQPEIEKQFASDGTRWAASRNPEEIKGRRPPCCSPLRPSSFMTGITIPVDGRLSWPAERQGDRR